MKKILTIAALFFTSMFMFSADVNAEVTVCHYHRNYGMGGKGDLYIIWDQANNTYKVEWKETNFWDTNGTKVISKSNHDETMLISSAAYKDLTVNGECPNRAFIDENATTELCIDDYTYNVAHHDHTKSQTTESYCGDIQDWNAGTEFDVDTRLYLKTGADYFDKKVDEALDAAENVSVSDITYETCVSGGIGTFIQNKISETIDPLIAGWPAVMEKKINKELGTETIEPLKEQADSICETLINQKAATGAITEEEAQEYIEEIQLVTADDILSDLSLSTSKYFKFDLKAKPICGIFGEKTWGYVQMAYSMIKLFIPAIIVLLGMVDFLKVLFSGEEKDMKTSGIKFMKRIAAGIIFILLPVLIEFLIHVVGFSENCLQQLFKISL